MFRKLVGSSWWSHSGGGRYYEIPGVVYEYYGIRMYINIVVFGVNHTEISYPVYDRINKYIKLFK